ncbi:MAG: hypothetical protein RIB84_02185 [Sneathiellaceae bacterium]
MIAATLDAAARTIPRAIAQVIGAMTARAAGDRLALVLLSLALLWPACPSAADTLYQPYRIAADGQAAPPFAVALPGGEIASFALPPVTLQVFAPLGAVMARAAGQSAGYPAWQPEAGACPASLPAPPPVGATCRGLAAATASVLAQGAASCADLAHPERFVMARRPGEVGLGDLGTIPGLIAVAGRALAEASFPASLADAVGIDRLRRVIGKIRLPALARDAAAFDRAAGHLADRLQAPGAAGCGPAPALRSLAALRSRVAALLAERVRIDAMGQAAVAAEEAALRAAGRERAPLPYPGVTAPERAELSMLLGGVYWRMRGGGLLQEPASTQTTRVYYNALPMAAIGFLNGGAEGWAAGLAIFSRIFEGWGSWMDMGRTPGGADALADLQGMTARGARQVGIAAPLLASGGYDTAWLEAGGLHLGPVYYFAWERLGHLRIGADLAPPLQPFLEGPTAWGEALGGAAISYGFARSLLAGRPVPLPPPPLDRIGR